jgi:hypothetical protein
MFFSSRFARISSFFRQKIDDLGLKVHLSDGYANMYHAGMCVSLYGVSQTDILQLRALSIIGGE